MSVQPRSLTTTQAVDILETLSLLTTTQHQNSKLVIYETKIELESDSSTWRTFKAWTSPALSTAGYYAGYSVETGSRDIAELSPLLERAHQAFQDQKFNFHETQQNKKRVDLAEKALQGLASLVQHEYLSDAHKAGFVSIAQQKLKEILAFLGQNSRFEYEDPFAKQLREKEKEIELLKKENDDLYKLVADKERYIAVVSQLFEKQKGKISKLEGLIVRDVSRDPMELDKEVPTQVLIGRVHVLTGVLASRKH